MIIATFDRPQWFPAMINDMRQMHSDQGGQAEDFTDWLKEQGCTQLGVCTILSDELELYAKLKYA